MAGRLPPPPQSNDFKSREWQDWFFKLAGLAGNVTLTGDVTGSGTGSVPTTVQQMRLAELQAFAAAHG